MALRRDDARDLAWQVLIAVERGAFADAELGRRLDDRRLTTSDRGLAVRLVYGTLAWQGLLDHILRRVGRDPARLDLEIRALLRMALYQLAKLDRIPAYAAVNTAVDLAAGFRGGRAKGLVNAVLRRCLERGLGAGDVGLGEEKTRDSIGIPSRSEDLAGYLSLAWSHPRWLVEMWLAELGAEDTEALLQADNQAAPTVLRANRLRVEPEALLEELREAAHAARRGRWAASAVVLEEGLPAVDGATLEAGRCSVQGEASQLVALLLGARPGMDVLDACAAPGGKTTAIAEQMENRGTVLAIDPSDHGLRRLAASAVRLGLNTIRTRRGDVRKTLRDGETFDAVLVDAPCSGLGTLRQHPEIRWRRTPRDLEDLAREQSSLLAAAADRVRPGGALVYATCTIARIENDDVVRPLQESHPELVLDDPRPFLPPAARELVENDFLRTFPHRHDLDGFFAARLVRR